jgi:3-methyladenine DNA glycosylase AlkD
MTVAEIMSQLEAKGSESIKKLLLKHGIKEPFFGVKIADLKPIQKKIKKDYELAKGLYATGNADAMYLAGLIADDDAMTTDDLNLWVKQATSNNISEYTVPWVAAQGRHGWELGNNWINDTHEHVEAAGWSTLSNFVALKPDSELDIPALRSLIKRVEETIKTAPNRVRYTMNAFLISAGTYVIALTDDAIAAAQRIGEVEIEMNGTACKVPGVKEYIQKAADRGGIGKKKKMVKC